MTIKQVQELYFIAESKDIDFDKSVKMVGIITGQTPDEVDGMSIKRFNKICLTIKKQFDIFGSKLHKGKPKQFVYSKYRRYRLEYDINKIDAGKYVEGVTFGKEIVKNLHRILATMATPVDWLGRAYKRSHDDISTDMESVKFEAAYHAAVFFYTQFTVSMRITQPFLIEEMVKKGVEKKKAEELLTASQRILDGSQMPRWSANLKQYLLNRYGV